MRLRDFFTDDDAQSEVVGTVLLVAITVVVAAVLDVFALGVGQETEAVPQAAFDVQFGESTVNVTHAGGDTIPSGDDLQTGVSDGTLSGTDWPDDAPVTSGTSVTLTHRSGGSVDPWDGETVSVVWRSGSGENSGVLARTRAPTA